MDGKNTHPAPHETQSSLLFSDNNTAPLNTLVSGRYSKLTTSLVNQGPVQPAGIHLAGQNVNLTFASTGSTSSPFTLNGNPGAILKTGGGGLAGVSVVSGSTMAATINPQVTTAATLSNNNQELILRPVTGDDYLQIDMPIAGTGQVTKSGAGQLILSAPNIYAGTTMITQGTVQLTGNGTIGTSTSNAGEIRMATVAGQTATLNIDSATSGITMATAASSFRVGEAGDAVVNQSNGTVNASNYLVLGESIGSSGTYNLSGGTLNVKTNNAGTPNLVVGRAGTGAMTISGSAVLNVLNGAQLQLGTGVFNSGQFQGMVPNANTSIGTGTITQTGGAVNVAVNNGAYQSNTMGGVFIGVDGAGTYSLNGGTLTTPMIGRGNGSATFNLGSGTLRAATPVPTQPVSVFHPSLAINVTGTGTGKGIIDTNGNDVVMTSTITGAGGFAKAGTGTLSVLGTGSTYAGGTDINQGTVISSNTGLGVGNVNVGAGNTLQVQGVQQGLLASFYNVTATSLNPAVTTGSAAMAVEFSSLENLNAFLDGKAAVAVESTAARGKTGVDYLDLGGANGATALPPAVIATRNGDPAFIAKLEGKFDASVAGDYTFQTRSDDNTVIWIDGQLVVDNNRDQGQTVRTGVASLTAGLHDIVVAYRQGGGGGGFSVGVTLPGQGQSYTIGSELNMSNALVRHGSNDLTIGSLSGAGSVQLAPTGTLTTGLDNTNTVFSGIISNAGNFVKSGTGRQELTGISTYTGTTTINGGILAVNGSIASSSMTTVDNGGTLGGSGFVGDLTVNSGGTVSPGNSPGILHTGSVTTNSGAIWNMEINGTVAGTQHDQIQTTGTIDLDGTLVLSLGYTPAYGDKVFLWLNDGTDAVSGIWDTLTEGSQVPAGGGMEWVVSYKDDNTANPTGPSSGLGNDISFYAVPEAGTSALVLLAGTGLLVRRRRTKKA